MLSTKRPSILLFLALLTLVGCGTSPTPIPAQPTPAAPPPTITATLTLSQPTSTSIPTSPATFPSSPTDLPATSFPTPPPTATPQPTIDLPPPTIAPIEPQPTPTTPTSSNPPVGTADPDLKPGFPISIPQIIGPNIAVGNTNSDPDLEIAVTTVGTDSPETLIIKPNGAILGRIPESARQYPVLMGELSASSPGLEILNRIISSRRQDRMVLEYADNAYTSDGQLLPGWSAPKWKGASVFPMPLLADLDADGLNELVEISLGPLKPSGATLFSPPSRYNAFAVGDMDGDSNLDILSEGQSSYLMALRADGSIFGQYPTRNSDFLNVTFFNNYVVGDLDGDGKAEVVVLLKSSVDYTAPAIMEVWSPDGQVKAHVEIPIDTSLELAQSALGDLDCDNLPEIVLQLDYHLYAWHSDGTPLTGWPLDLDGGGLTPLIGDIDGDGYAEVVILDKNYRQLKAFNRLGQLLPRFPKEIQPLGNPSPVQPVLADIDADGRTELLAVSLDLTPSGDFSPSQKSYLWAYDLHGSGPYGPIQWGQYRGGPEGQGRYIPQPQTCRP